MPEISERVELVKAIFAGLKDIGLVVASVATIWIQANNSGKLDVAAAKTEAVETKLEATKAVNDAKLDTILEVAKGGPMGTAEARP
jgi:hypothetical protein